MVTCSRCGKTSSLAEFAHVGQASEVGPVSLRRCPACGGPVAVVELELEAVGPPSPGPWGTNDVWGKRFTFENGEV